MSDEWDDDGTDTVKGLWIFFGVPLAFFLVWLLLTAGAPS